MRYLLIAITAVVLPLLMGVDDAPWRRTANNDCLVWDDLPQPDETVTWSGACIDGKASGAGTQVFRYRIDGVWKEERYVGEMQGGKLHGRGTLFYDNGDRYEGDFKGGMPNGDGTLKKSTGDIVTGNWSNGCFRQGDRVAGVGTTKEKCGFK